MCVSVTRSFELPIPRCSDSVEDLGDSYGRLFFISLDARSSYHQILVRKYSQEKLAVFTLEGKKKCFIVIPFGPKNAPVFYTAMMKTLHDAWVVIFNSTKYSVQSDLSITKIF